MSLTLSECLVPVGKVTNLCSTDSRVTDYINQACERLLWKGNYKSTYGRFAITATTSNSSGAIIAWPRELQTIHKAYLDYSQVSIRNGWYEFLEHGPGLLDAATYSGVQCIDRGSSPLAMDLAAGEVLRLYTTVAADANQVILVQGKDSTGTEIRTEYPVSSGTYITGRKLTLTGTYVQSPEQWTTVDAVQKPVTKGSITVKAYNTTTLVERTIGVWHANDTKPEYRRSIIPGLFVDGSTSKTVTVIGSLRFIPATVSTDWVIPDNLAAIKLMTRAIYLEENDRISDAAGYEALAKQKLEEQLLTFIGPAKQPLGLDYGRTYGGAGLSPVQ